MQNTRYSNAKERAQKKYEESFKKEIEDIGNQEKYSEYLFRTIKTLKELGAKKDEYLSNYKKDLNNTALTLKNLNDIQESILDSGKIQTITIIVLEKLLERNERALKNDNIPINETNITNQFITKAREQIKVYRTKMVKNLLQLSQIIINIDTDHRETFLNALKRPDPLDEKIKKVCIQFAIAQEVASLVTSKKISETFIGKFEETFIEIISKIPPTKASPTLKTALEDISKFQIAKDNSTLKNMLKQLELKKRSIVKMKRKSF